MKIHSCSTGLEQFGLRLYRAPEMHHTCFWEAGIISLLKYFCMNHSVKKAPGNLILNPILTRKK